MRNCSFRFDINISGWQAFISKPISISILGKLDFESNTENEIELWAFSIPISISKLKSPHFGRYLETISISKPIFYYISPPKCWPQIAPKSRDKGSRNQYRNQYPFTHYFETKSISKSILWLFCNQYRFDIDIFGKFRYQNQYWLRNEFVSHIPVMIEDVKKNSRWNAK